MPALLTFNGKQFDFYGHANYILASLLAEMHMLGVNSDVYKLRKVFKDLILLLEQYNSANWDARVDGDMVKKIRAVIAHRIFPLFHVDHRDGYGRELYDSKFALNGIRAAVSNMLLNEERTFDTAVGEKPDAVLINQNNEIISGRRMERLVEDDDAVRAIVNKVANSVFALLGDFIKEDLEVAIHGRMIEGLSYVSIDKELQEFFKEFANAAPDNEEANRKQAVDAARRAAPPPAAAAAAPPPVAAAAPPPVAPAAPPPAPPFRAAPPPFVPFRAAPPPPPPPVAPAAPVPARAAPPPPVAPAAAPPPVAPAPPPLTQAEKAEAARKRMSGKHRFKT